MVQKVPDTLRVTSVDGVLKGAAGALVEAVAGTDFTSPTGVEGLSNKAITGCSIDNTPIGGTTPNTGAFTTLTASAESISAIRLNPRAITTNTTIPSAYNASSVGPVTVAEGVTVTVSNSATWSIH